MKVAFPFYCMHCRVAYTSDRPVRAMLRGQPGMQSLCPQCNTWMYKMGQTPEEAEAAIRLLNYLSLLL